MEVRHIGTTYRGSAYALGEYGIGAQGARIQLYVVDESAPFATFDTVLEFGGRRLAIAPTGDRVVACGWTAGRGSSGRPSRFAMTPRSAAWRSGW